MEKLLFKNKYRIPSARLAKYDYSLDGAYFVTICTKDRLPWFGENKNGVMGLSNAGSVAWQCWLDLPNHYINCILDTFIVMPDHTHGIIIINNHPVETGFKPVSCNEKITGFKPVSCNEKITGLKHPIVGTETGLKPVSTDGRRHGLSEIVRGFKTFTSRRINEQNNNGRKFQWQSRFYDRIIRNEQELYAIQKYIINNPYKHAQAK